MSEHELWNELGNLYFLNGAHDQAIQAYNKAIQIENKFGKPYSNLALIYSKQKRYNDAVSLYKRSLELLSDDYQKAVAWNRLGNVYRQLKDYQEAVFAFKSADELRSALEQSNELSDQIQNIVPESDQQAYEVVEEQQDYPYHAVDFMYELEPGFNEKYPAPVLVEAEITAVDHQHRHHVYEQAATRFVNPSEPDHRDEILEENQPELLSSSDKADEKQLVQPESDRLTESVAQDTSANDENDLGFKVGNWNGSPYPQASVDRQEFQSDEVAPMNSEVNVSLESVVEESISDYDEPIARLQGSFEASPKKLSASNPLTDYAADDTHFEADIEIQIPPAQPEAELDNKFDPNSGRNLQDSTVDECQQTRNDEPAKTEMNVIDSEEKKLAKQIEINPRSATTWEALGTLYKTAGRYEEAIHAFKHAISIEPREVSYYHNLGLVYAAQGNNQEAFGTFQKVLELNPNHSLTHASLGGYYKKMGLDELAKKHIGKAMKHIYESENEYNRACLDAICGNNDQAIELLRAALENKQTYVDWVLNDPDLDTLRDDERYKQLIADFSH